MGLMFLGETPPLDAEKRQPFSARKRPSAAAPLCALISGVQPPEQRETFLGLMGRQSAVLRYSGSQ